jgi:undecaprenyl diphosphate synthase
MTVGSSSPDRALAAERCRAAGLDPARLPRHVAMIMDGNGRWAKGKGWERTRGHRKGADAVRTVTTECVRLGVARLTLYAFSSENWSRPAHEIAFLMALLKDFLRQELPTLRENGVRLEAIGRLERLPQEVRAILAETIAATAGHGSMVLCLALSYGGRDELADACRAIAVAVRDGRLAVDAIDAATVASHLYAPAAADVDLVVRTAGEQRLSNFLPWQTTYAEYVSLPVLWPDMGVADLHAALREFQGRERRFGAL